MSVASCQGVIYAMGGFDGIVRLNSAEMYVPSQNQWSLICSMHHPRSDASAAELDGVLELLMNFLLTS